MFPSSPDPAVTVEPNYFQARVDYSDRNGIFEEAQMNPSARCVVIQGGDVARGDAGPPTSSVLDRLSDYFLADAPLPANEHAAPFGSL
jgi:hypothetical protein